MERAAHLAARNTKQLRGLCTCGSGRYGNAATRLEEVAVSTGVWAYGAIPTSTSCSNSRMWRRTGASARPAAQDAAARARA